MSSCVENAAADFIGWREATKKLKGDRARLRCEHEAPSERDREPAYVNAGSTPGPAPQYRDPCWKYGYPVGEEFVHMPPERWCASCVERQRVQEAWRAATRKRTGALRKLTLAVLAATGGSDGR